ncbi:hypothetical protein [Aquimarina sp. Aq78]|uniref:hypothetical protein n=1 Tax=Aquimarina sp. Aq78 TaxID=1191889 RepID=UPI000D10E07A|nr:hypothetical protein [Aquimarina sp. Aq78]
MKNFRARTLTGILIVLISLSGFSQELSVTKSSSANINKLPEYIIITSENTKLLGGIGISIDYKRSGYKEELRNLEELLQDGDKLRVRNQTDLLNSMSILGFEYVDAYNANSGTLGVGGGDDVEVFGSNSKFRINMVFRKKEQFR